MCVVNVGGRVPCIQRSRMLFRQCVDGSRKLVKMCRDINLLLLNSSLTPDSLSNLVSKLWVSFFSGRGGDL